MFKFIKSKLANFGKKNKNDRVYKSQQPPAPEFFVQPPLFWGEVEHQDLNDNPVYTPVFDGDGGSGGGAGAGASRDFGGGDFSGGGASGDFEANNEIVADSGDNNFDSSSFADTGSDYSSSGFDSSDCGGGGDFGGGE